MVEPMATPKVHRHHRYGFTLVELLVVIGIIALLIAILLPSLGKARKTSQRIACAAKLHQIMLAAELHRADHQGYYPLVGLLPDCAPSDYINDTYARHYTYCSITGISAAPRQLAPIANALATEMTFKTQINAATNAATVGFMFDPSNYIKNFLCPAQADSPSDVVNGQPAASFLMYVSQAPTGVGSFSEPQSYIYNEAVLGYNDALGRLRGQASRVHQPALTMFAADGLHGLLGREADSGATFTLYNNTATAPITMAQAYIGNLRLAEDSTCFDKRRHQGMINIAFCDSHVETRNITVGDLNTIFLLPP